MILCKICVIKKSPIRQKSTQCAIMSINARAMTGANYDTVTGEKRYAVASKD